jgi:polyisoprenoid-binding protein YceI
MTLHRILPLALGALMLVAPVADGDGVVVDKSEIGFTVTQMGVKFEGRFRKWKADIVFQPKALAASRAAFDVDLGSIDLASDESDAEAKGPLWFNAAKFPVAHFMSMSMKDLGANRYEIAGKLTLKGITRDCVVPVTVKSDSGGNRVAEGNFSIRRLDYQVGEGEWADTDTVANDILVRVRITLAPAA